MRTQVPLKSVTDNEYFPSESDIVPILAFITMFTPHGLPGLAV